MKIALEVWSSDIDQVTSTCHRAESLDIDGFYYGESPHDLNLDCWSTLAGLAATTSRIRLGPVITNILPTYRSTALLAKQAATVAALAPGRVDFRTGVGAAAGFARPWWEPFGVTYPDYDQRLADLTAALEQLPALWHEQPGPPVTIAARGRRALQLAADRAHVWEASYCTPAEYCELNARFESIEPRNEVQRSLEIDGFVSQTDKGHKLLLDRVHAERADEDLEAIFARALTGTPNGVADTLQQLVAVGVDQVVVALHDPHDPDAIEALAEAATMVRDQNSPT